MTSRRPRYVVIVGGTWEKRWGLYGPVVHELDGQWNPVWVDYPASYGTPEAFEDSLDRGVTSLILALQHIPMSADIAVLGFSQGAAVVEKALREMHANGALTSASILLRIVYVGLCGNPYRAAHDQIGPDPGGSGVIGPLAPKGVIPIRGRWENFALPGDVISSSTADSLVRAIYPFTRWMSVQTPQRWALDALSRTSALWVMKNVPELRDPRRWPELLRRVTVATRALEFYQQSGIHGQYMIRALGDGQPTAGRHIVRSLEEIAWQSN